LRAVEAIELLIEADQWQAADDMYTNRLDNGDALKHLPDARLGQRAATAFVATTARRDACAAQLNSRTLGYFLASVGLFATMAGDLVTAQEFMSLGIRHDRDAGDMSNVSIDLRNLTECLTHLGQVVPARSVATEALSYAQTTGDRKSVRNSHVNLGWAAGLAGDTAEAERQFAAADLINVVDDIDGDHMSSNWGIHWAELLARTGREGPARALTFRNVEICRHYGWNADKARCDLILGRLALTTGDTTAAGEYLAQAVQTFRDGDFLTELAVALAELARWAQAAGDLDAAERHMTEAITIAAPRGLVPSQAAALAARAYVRADQAVTAEPDLLHQGRDAADAALRLATRHQLAWHELDALHAHAALDRAEGIDRGWATKVETLHARLVPPGLDPDPLATVERLVAAQKTAEKEDDDLS
jgi:tetratricopeptide (TPR) repeat protein